MSMKILTSFTVASLLMIVTAHTALAETVVRSGDTVSIPEEQLIEGDFYSAAGKINVSGEVGEDLVVAAGQVVVNGSVGDNAFIVAGQTDVHGTIGDDLRIVSGEVTIADPVMGDLLVVGGTVNILSTASVAGDVLIYAGDAVIEGSVGGDVMGTVANLRVDSQVAGDVDVTVDQLTLGDRAVIDGSVRYVSKTVVIRGTEASIVGDLTRSDPVLPGSQPSAQAALVPIIVLLFSIAVWYLVSRKTLSTITARALSKSPRPLLFGVLTILFAPIAISLLLVSMIGAIVGAILLLGYLLFILLGVIGVAAVLGKLFMRLFTKSDEQITLLALVSGSVVVALLLLLPVIGQIALAVVFILTFGAIIDVLLRPGSPAGENS